MPSEYIRKLFLKSVVSFFYLVLLFILTLIFPRYAYACSEEFVRNRIEVTNCILSDFCGSAAKTCNLPVGVEDCDQTGAQKPLYDKVVRFIYNDNPNTPQNEDNTSCDSTVIFLDQTACIDTDLTRQATRLSCIGSCNPNSVGCSTPGCKVLREGIEVTYNPCREDLADSFCTAGIDNLCTSNITPTKTGPGEWCETWRCPWGSNCGTPSWSCSPNPSGPYTSLNTCNTSCPPPICTCPSPSDVACGTSSSSPTNGPNCIGTCPTVTGTSSSSCPTGQSCLNSVCQIPPACTVTLSANTTSVSSGGQVILSWTTTDADPARRGFGTMAFQGATPLPDNTPYPALTLTNDTCTNQFKDYQVNFYNSAGQACASNIVTVTISPPSACTTPVCSSSNCGVCGDCGACIAQSSCGWNGSSCVSGTSSGPTGSSVCQPGGTWHWNSCTTNQAPQCTTTGTCTLTVNSTTQTSASITASAAGFTDSLIHRFDWFVDSQNNFVGTNKPSDQPSTFSGFSSGTQHTIYAQAWSTTGSPAITSICQATFTTQAEGAKYKCSSGSCVRDDVNGTYTDATCNNSCTITTCDCTANIPACGETTNGVCAGTTIPCSKTGPSCVDDATIVFNFYNEDGITPYSGAGTIRLLEDDNYDQYGNSHNNLFYGPNGTYSHNTNQDVRAADITSWHPYRDPGYQINADGTLSGCPPQNLDTCCTGPQEKCSEVEGWECTTESGYTCIPSCQYSCRNGAYCCGECTVNQPNDVFLDRGSTPNDPSAWPRCFSPVSANHVDITATNTSFRYSEGYFDLGLPTQQDPRDQLRAYSIGAPAGYQLKVNVLCKQDYDGGCNTGVLQGLKNQGITVKNFTSTVAGLTNYWASPYEKVHGSTSILAYDVYVLVPKFQLSGRVFEDLDYNQTDTGEPGLANSVVTVTSAAGQSFSSSPTDSTGAYSILNLPSGNYSLTFNPPQGYTSTMTLPISISLTADTVQNLGAARSYTISGTVRTDTNNNGVCENSEPGATTASVSLLGGPTAKGSVNPSGTGSYSFTGLRAGTYLVSVNTGTDQEVSPSQQSLTVGPNASGVNFCVNTYASWLQTTGGDIHSNTNISLPRGPIGP